MNNHNIIEQFSVAFEALGAEWVMWLLLVLSVLSVAVMLERTLFFLTHQLGSARELVREKLKNGDLDGAVAALGQKKGLEAEVVREAVKAAARSPESVEKVIHETIVIEKLRYERWLSYLGTLGNNAPFIGLFGTVLGIINAFSALASSAKSGTVTSGSSTVMHGISEALVATAVGLLVALPAVAAFNAFARWLKTTVARAEALGLALESHLASGVDEPGKADRKEAPVALAAAK